MSGNVWTPTDGGIEVCKAPREMLFAWPRVVVKVIDREQKVVDHIISTEDEDRDFDILRVSGWLLDEYRRNPVVLLVHDRQALNVGKSIGIRKTTINGKRVLQSRTMFAGDEQRHPLAEMTARMVMDDFTRATSVGFLPKKRKARAAEDVDPENEIAREWKASGWEYLKHALLEYSIVPVPSNPGVDVERAMSVAREYLKGADLDAYRRMLAAEPGAKILSRPMDEVIVRGMDLDREPLEDDGWLDVGKWDDGPGCPVAVIETKATPLPEVRREPDTEPEPEPATVPAAEMTFEEALIHANECGGPESPDGVKQTPEPSKSAEDTPNRMRPILERLGKSDVVMCPRCGKMQCSIPDDGMMSPDMMSAYNAHMDSCGSPMPGEREVRLADTSVLATLLTEMRLLKAYFDDALVDLWERTENEKNDIRATAKAAAPAPEDALPDPARGVEVASPPAKTNGKTKAGNGNGKENGKAFDASHALASLKDVAPLLGDMIREELARERERARGVVA